MKILSHLELRVYQAAALLRKKIFVLTLSFPADERFELRSQIRRSSRSVCASIAEAWRKRHYPAHWISKLSDAEQEAAETQVWVETALECDYITPTVASELHQEYEAVLGQLVTMAANPEKWTVRR